MVSSAVTLVLKRFKLFSFQETFTQLRMTSICKKHHQRSDKTSKKSTIDLANQFSSQTLFQIRQATCLVPSAAGSDRAAAIQQARQVQQPPVRLQGRRLLLKRACRLRNFGAIETFSVISNEEKLLSSCLILLFRRTFCQNCHSCLEF